MIISTKTRHPATEITLALALTLVAVASMWAWVLRADGAAGTSTIMYACFLHPAQSDEGWRFGSRQLKQVTINLRGGLRLAPPGNNEATRPV